MLLQGLSQKVTRARPTSNMMFSAAAIAVVSEVNPDEPGAFLFPSYQQEPLRPNIFSSFLFLFLAIFLVAPAHAAFQRQIALDSAIYNNTLIQITPMLFHHIELGMNYEAVKNTAGKSALYCDSGESTCKLDHASLSKNCLNREFIYPNKTWVCHWEGSRSNQQSNPRLEVWFVGTRAAKVLAIMPNGSIYRRDSGNSIHLER